MRCKKIASLCAVALACGAEGASLEVANTKIDVSAFVDAFYVYDFNRPQIADNKRQDFLYNHNRHNEFSINLALVKVAVSSEKYRANIALQAGTYADDNYAHESSQSLKNIHEANAGIALDEESKVWLDAGIFASNLGFDSAVSMDNYNLTRSLSAESSPYYLSGAKLTYTPTQEWELAVLLTNGWQRIKRVEGNSLLSFGTQIIYMPSDEVKLNWSTFIGTEEPDVTRKMRYFNNFFGEFVLDTNLRVIAGVDVGLEQKAKGSSDYNRWYIPSVLAKYTLSNIHAIGVRAEYVYDTEGIVIHGNGQGARMLGLSSNFDYMPQPNIALRAEARYLKDTKEVFATNDTSNFFITTSLALKF